MIHEQTGVFLMRVSASQPNLTIASNDPTVSVYFNK